MLAPRIACYSELAMGCNTIQKSLLFFAVIALTSCNSSSPPAKQESAALHPWNVVVITIDTLRADRLHCYGNQAIATPSLDALAQRGARFQNAVAQTPLTPPSHASIFTGTNPNVHQVRNTGGFALKSSSTTLAKILQSRGWDTAAFVGASVLKKAFGLNQGFDFYDDQMPKAEKGRDERDDPERRASAVVDHALTWLNTQSGKPFFVWLHLYDPHEPYRPPEPFPKTYEGEIAYTDQQVGRFLTKIAPEKTIIVVVGDHGESLGEHGEFNHGVFLYDSTLRIPLLIAGPGVPAVAVTQQARTIDILPTVLDLLGGKPSDAVQGVSLTPAFQNANVATTYSYEETLYPKMNMGWAELRGIRTNRWKYVRAPKPELYDLSIDPTEKDNVFVAHPAEAQDLETHLKKASLVTDEKVSSGVVDAHTMDQLKSLGYLSGVTSGEYQLNGKGPDPKDHTGTLLAFQTALGPGSHALSPARRIDILRQALAKDETNPSLYFYLAAEYEKNGKYREAMSVCESARSHGIISAKLLSRMGDLYLRDGKKERAVAAYELAAQYNPTDVESLSNLATAYLELGKLPEAERCFRRVLAVEEYAAAYNGLGLVAIQRQDPAAARTNFERAVELDPDLVEPQLNLGLLYKMAGDIPRARQHFQTFYKKLPAPVTPKSSPSPTRTRFNEFGTATVMERSQNARSLALCLFTASLRAAPDCNSFHDYALQAMSRKEFALAAQSLSAAFEACPTQHAILLELSDAYLHQRDFTAATQSIQRFLALEPNSVPGKLALANAYFMAQRLPESLEAIKAVLKAQPNQPAALKLKGNIEYLQGQLEASFNTFIAVLERYPQDEEAPYMLGRIYYQEGRIEQATGQFQRVLRINPKSYKAFDNLGLCYEALGDSETAIRYFLTSIKLVETAVPDYDWPYANLAHLLLEKGDSEKAFAAASKAADRNPYSARNFYLGGKALSQLGKNDLSINWLERSVSLDPKYPEPLYLLGRVYEQLGEHEKSKAALERFRTVKAAAPRERK